ncbi:MAG: hypothetical protein HKN70_14140 [Gammaproteobacteria bacterium]|nr:hypothetical protein [Gammaproteobacteria bacterium]
MAVWMRLRYLLLATPFLVFGAADSISIIANGLVCEFDAQCRTNFCSPGPSEKQFCTVAPDQCGVPGEDGVSLESFYRFEGALYGCETGPHLRRLGTAASSWADDIKPAWQEEIKAIRVAQMRRSLAAGDTFPALYNTQYQSMNFLVRARMEMDIAILSDLSEIALIPLAYLYNAEAVRQDTPTRASDITTAVTWQDKSPQSARLDNLNNIVQWHFFTSYLINSIVKIDYTQRSAAMNSVVDLYSKLFSFTLYEMVFNADNAFGWDFRGWSGCHKAGILGHREITQKKRHRKMDHLADAPCNAILDWDIQLWASVLEYVAAAATDPARVHYFTDQKKHSQLKDYLRLAFATVDTHHTETTVTDFDGNPTTGLIFDQGAWATHLDYKYAQSNSAYPPSDPDAPGPTDEIGEDVSHHIRYTWVLLSFFDNKSLLGTDFPDSADMSKFARQLAYTVFTKNFQRPQFNNFMDGSNGWFRVYPGPGGTVDKGPYGSGNIGIIYSGLGFYQPFVPEIRNILDSVALAYTHTSGVFGDRARQALDTGVWKNCTYSVEQTRWQQCEPYAGYLGFKSYHAESLAFRSQNY